MNKKLVKQYIQEYKNKFETINKLEIYKYQAVKQFQDNWDINAADFYEMLEKSLQLSFNLLDSGQYFPKGMLLQNAKETPEKIRDLFKNLFDEDSDIFERIESFRYSFKEISNKSFPEAKNDYQDHRAVIVYLALRFPERYFFYKYGIFKSFAEKIKYTYTAERGQIKNIGQYQLLCNLVKEELKEDQELLTLHRNRIPDDYYYYENLNILTQEFVYSVVQHLESIEVPQEDLYSRIVATSFESTEITTKETSVDFAPKTVNYIENNAQNKRIGDLGELWVVRYEKQKLEKANKPKLAQKVKHAAKEEGDGLGYDILSYDQDGKEIFIEVKTTTGNVNSIFYITRNELEKSKIEKVNYRLYRVYKYEEETGGAELQIISGDLSNLCKVPLTYQVNMQGVKNENE